MSITPKTENCDVARGTNAAMRAGVRTFVLFAFLAACSPASEPSIDDAGDDVVVAVDASTKDASADVAPHDAAHEAEAATPDPCSKHLTVLFSVGTGAGALKSHATSCWTVLDADGAANPAFRKCSTNDWTVHNASAPNYAYDDTNPNHDLTQEKNFIQQCASGATGDGFEYMAYRGGWRLVFPENHLKAFFAELHAGDGDVDDNWPSAYVNNSQLANHTVYPMINIGPTNVSNPAPTIKNDGLAICKTIKDGGMFGVYVGTWNQPMTSTDPRIVALASALDACTK